MQSLADQKSYICEMFGQKGVGLEIGVFLGQFSEHILKIAKPKKLYLVDPWDIDRSWPEGTPNKEWRTSEQMNDLALRVKTKFSKKKNVKICRMKSNDFFKTIPEDLRFDFIYVDGDHSYDGTLSDIQHAWLFIKPNGIIIIDDFNPNINYWGIPITRAVADFCNDKEIIPEILAANQCVIRKN
jgi:hypothetical protein